jgi:hypothetical protein
MCKLLDEPVLLSAAFAACKPDQFVSLGQHSLKGIKDATGNLRVTGS